MKSGRGRLLLAFAWLAALLLLALVFRSVGEGWPAIAVMLYWPPVVWLLPGPPLLIVALFRFDFRMLLTLAAAAVVGLHCLCGYRPPMPPSTKPDGGELVVTLITNNTGERGKVSLRPFKDRLRPDFLLLQDAPSRARRYRAAPGYEEFPHAEDIAEFTLVSKHPIVRKELITRPPTSIPRMMRYPLAARFEVEVAGQRIAIYNVHAFSPREHLQPKTMLSTLASGAAGWLPGTYFAERHQLYASFWNAQLAGATHLSARIAADPLPCLVGGDFNAPPLGTIHRELTRHLQDAHLLAGSGCGYSFPGQTGNPLAFFRPWLRLDYIFASHDWRCLASEVEPDSPAQHLAVAATLSLKPGQ